MRREGWRGQTHAATMTFAMVLATIGCSSEDPKVIYEYDSYTGNAFPDNRTPLVIPEGGAFFVTNSYSDSVTVLDATTSEIIGTYPVGRDPVSLDGPHHIVVSGVTNSAYIGLSYPTEDTGSGPHASHGSSIKPGFAQKISLTDMSIVGQVRVDNNPGDIVVSADGKLAFTSHFDLVRALQHPTDIDAARATIAVIDTSTMQLVDSPVPRRITTCVAPHGMVLSEPDGATAYVACYGEDVIAVVDVNAGTVERIPVGPNAMGFGNPTYGPYSLVTSPDGKTLVLGDTTSKDLRFFDIATKQILSSQTISVLAAPYFPAWSEDGTQLLIPMQGPDAIALVDVTTKMQLQYRAFTADECQLPHVATRLPDGTYALTCEGDHKSPGKVLWLDPKTLATTKSREVGVYPDALFFYRKSAP